MELADKIDPAEVLAHLNQLGYKNISPPQLKEFIRGKHLFSKASLANVLALGLIVFYSCCRSKEVNCP